MSPLVFTGRRSAFQVTGRAATFASPLDATTYYFGGNTFLTTTAGLVRAYIERAGTISTARLIVVVGGTLGTTEQCTASIRLNNTTDSTISAVVQFDQLLQVYVNTGLSIAVAAGDYIEWKIVTPTWATNPTNVVLSGDVLVLS